MKPGSGNSILTPRDIKIFKFLWHHKLATTAALNQKYFPGSKIKSAYNRLYALRKRDFLRLVVGKSAQDFAWSLSNKGFACLPELRQTLHEQGFLSENFRHDLIVSAALIGEFLQTRPDHLSIFTEQQLRRIKPDHFPEWVPKDTSHRPDGYWNVILPNFKRTTALEVELSHKSIAEYEFTGDFYQINSDVVDQILWIVGSNKIYKMLVNGLNKSIGPKISRHNFVSLNQFMKESWLAPITSGPLKGHPMCMVFGYTKRNIPGTFLTQHILDTRKVPRKSLTSGTLKNHLLGE